MGLAVGSPAPVPAAPTGPYIPAGNTPAPAPYGGTTFATGVFPTGSLPVGPSQIPLNGSPGKLVSGIAAAMLAGAVGLVITF